MAPEERYTRNHYPSIREFFADYMRVRLETNFVNIRDVPTLGDSFPFFSSWAYLRQHEFEIGGLTERRAFREIEADIPEFYKILDVATTLKDPHLTDSDRNTQINKIERYDRTAKQLTALRTADDVARSYREGEKSIGRLKGVSKEDVKAAISLLATEESRFTAQHNRHQFFFPADPHELVKMTREKEAVLVDIAQKARGIIDGHPLPPTISMLGVVDVGGNGYPLGVPREP